MASCSEKWKQEHLEQEKCIICLSDGVKDLQMGTPRGLIRLEEVAKVWYGLKDSKYQEAIERISCVMQSSHSYAPVVLSQRKCYSDFTCNGKIECLVESRCSSSNSSKHRKHSDE